MDSRSLFENQNFKCWYYNVLENSGQVAVAVKFPNGQYSCIGDPNVAIKVFSSEIRKSKG